jgi:hypothetical protein
MASKTKFDELLDDPASQALMPIAMRRALLGNRWLTLPHESLNCRDCQDYLQMCVEQMDWIKAAEEALQESLRDPNRQEPYGKSEIVDSMIQAIRELFQAWQFSATKAERWTFALKERAFERGDDTPFTSAKTYVELRLKFYADVDSILEEFKGPEAQILLD